MRPYSHTLAIVLLATLPALGNAQAPPNPPVQHPGFEQLADNQWIRLAGPEIGRRQGRVSGHTSTELLLTTEAEPLRLAATSVDTIWTRGRHTVAGLVAGALVFGALGAGAGTALGEENAGTGRNIIGMAAVGALSGALFGAVIGTAIPRWHRSFP